jgi:hypothetical protein
MVKVLYNAEWEPNDIDVFEHPKQEKYPSLLEPKTDYNFLLEICGEEEGKETYETFHGCLKSLGMVKVVKDVWKHKSNKTDKNINYIPPLLDIGPMRRIYESFDNDIVKIAYYQNKLYVKDWSKLFARKSYSVPSGVVWIGCYEGLETCMGEEITDKVLQEMRSRNAKYTNRGFTIINHPQTLSLIEKSLQYSWSDEVNTDFREGRDKNFCNLFALLDFNKYLDEELD